MSFMVPLGIELLRKSLVCQKISGKICCWSLFLKCLCRWFSSPFLWNIFKEKELPSAKSCLIVWTILHLLQSASTFEAVSRSWKSIISLCFSKYDINQLIVYIKLKVLQTTHIECTPMMFAAFRCCVEPLFVKLLNLRAVLKRFGCDVLHPDVFRIIPSLPAKYPWCRIQLFVGWMILESSVCCSLTSVLSTCAYLVH